MKKEQCSETSACKIQTPGNYPEEGIQHSEHRESLKSRNFMYVNCDILQSVYSKQKRLMKYRI